MPAKAGSKLSTKCGLEGPGSGKSKDGAARCEDSNSWFRTVTWQQVIQAKRCLKRQPRGSQITRTNLLISGDGRRRGEKDSEVCENDAPSEAIGLNQEKCRQKNPTKGKVS
jgi:hypothetical protein